MRFEDLDPYAILKTLGLSEATAITPVHGGSDTGIWQVERGSKVYALRVFRRGEHADGGDGDCEEFRSTCSTGTCHRSLA